MIHPKYVFQKIENKYDVKARTFLRCHPCLAFLAMFVGLPLLALIALCICAAMIMLPVSWLFHWL